MQLLDIYAGATALKRIQQQGLHQGLFDYVLGASGGPKWFALAGLDRVLMPLFFADRNAPLHMIGSSAGAFRAACYAQQDPLAAINRLADSYAKSTYSANPSRQEITLKGLQMLDCALADTGVDEILNNPVVKAHFIVARCRGLTRFEAKPIQMAGLVASAGANLVKRNWLKSFYQRYFFSAPKTQLKVTCPDGLGSHFVPLSKANLAHALMASGSIPLVLEGMENIAGAPKGVYRDGGIIDYHFDLQFGPLDGLILYPHFYPTPIPGWFDKRLKNRKAHQQSYDKVVMLVPSKAFVAALPFGKIPDRKDFEYMPAEQRIPYWLEVIKQSNRLGQAFLDFVEKPDLTRIRTIQL